MGAETWASVGVTLATAASGVWAARAARRTPRQERRDDFTAIKDGLNERINDLKSEVDKQQERITDQDLAIGWLLSRVRSLVSHIRGAGLEPPPGMAPPDRVKDYLNHLDM